MRRFNRDVTNRLQGRFAGRPEAYASVMGHRGRNSGRAYETPVVPFAIDDGFVIPLPDGNDTDWLKNVLAHGSAVLVTDGRTYTLDRPEVVGTDTIGDAFPAGERRTHPHRWFGVTQCLRARGIEAEAARSEGNGRHARSVPASRGCASGSSRPMPGLPLACAYVGSPCATSGGRAWRPAPGRGASPGDTGPSGPAPRRLGRKGPNDR